MDRNAHIFSAKTLHLNYLIGDKYEIRFGKKKRTPSWQHDRRVQWAASGSNDKSSAPVSNSNKVIDQSVNNIWWQKASDEW